MAWFSGARSGHRAFRYQYAWSALLLLFVPLQDTHPLDVGTEYDNARQMFLHGYLEKSQWEAAQGYVRFLGSNP
jgi:hypothetical protein